MHGEKETTNLSVYSPYLSCGAVRGARRPSVLTEPLRHLLEGRVSRDKHVPGGERKGICNDGKGRERDPVGHQQHKERGGEKGEDMKEEGEVWRERATVGHQQEKGRSTVEKGEGAIWRKGEEGRVGGPD